MKASAYFKYSLIETVNGSTTTVASGNFQDVNSSSFILKSMTKVNTLGVTYSYEFRLWLEDNGCTLSQINAGTCENQNELMNKSFRGRIRVSTAAR